MRNKYKVFAEHYAASGNATEAAKAAGYSEKTAYSQGARLLKNVEVQDYLTELQDSATADRIASMSEVKAFWSEVMDDPAQKTADRLKASELLAKSAGAFIHTRPDDGGSDYVGGEWDGEDVIIYLPDNGRPMEEETA